MTETHHRKISPNRKKGILAVLTAWLFFTTAIALSRFATERTSVPTVLFFQNFISLIAVLPWMIKNGRKSLLISKFGVILIRTLAGYLNFAFIYLAVQRTTLVNVVLLSNTAPLFIPLILWYWKRIKIKTPLWAGIVIGFIGIAVMLQPNCQILNTGALFALGAALCFSVSMITQRRLVKTERIYSVLFFYFFISMVLSTPFMIDRWKPLDTTTLLLLLSIGCCFAIGQVFFLRSFKYAKPSFLSSFNYSAIVYGAAFEWFIWGRFPGWLCIVGILIVCTGGLITTLQGKEKG